VKSLIIFAFTTFAILIFFTTSVFADIANIGVKGGVNLSRLRNDVLENYTDYLQSFCAGGFISLNISGAFAIQPEVLFTIKGAKMEENILGELLDMKFKLNYLEIPVLFKISLPPLSKIKLNLFAGPAIAIKLKAIAEISSGGMTKEEKLENIQDSDMGLVMGGGIDLGGFIIEGRYTMGLNSIYDSEDDVFEDKESDLSNSVFSFLVGFYF
jgi:hypothetical protein